MTGSSLGGRDYTYDQYRRLRTSTDGRGVTTTYSYDPDDRITNVTRSTGSQVQCIYDSANRLKTNPAAGEKVYQSPGIRLDYDHEARRVTANAAEACVFNRVRRETCPLGTHVFTIGSGLASSSNLAATQLIWLLSDRG